MQVISILMHKDGRRQGTYCGDDCYEREILNLREEDIGFTRVASPDGARGFFRKRSMIKGAGIGTWGEIVRALILRRGLNEGIALLHTTLPRVFRDKSREGRCALFCACG